MKLNTMYFSPTGGTKKVAEIISRGLESKEDGTKAVHREIDYHFLRRIIHSTVLARRMSVLLRCRHSAAVCLPLRWNALR